MGKHEQISGKDRVARRRATLRAQGLRPKQFWLPDLRDAKVVSQLHAEALAIAGSPREAEDQAWIDALSESWDDWPPGSAFAKG